MKKNWLHSDNKYGIIYAVIHKKEIIMQRRSIWIYGFAIFAMFFGSGNLVFPIEIGYYSGNSWFYGFLGLCCTGILLPFLGLFVIKLHKGSYDAFFNETGRFTGFLLPLFTLSLLGSFGVVPRCISVAYGGLNYAYPDLSLLVFSVLFCISMFFLCLHDHVMVKILGKWMSPILVLSLAILIGVGVFKYFYDIDGVGIQNDIGGSEALSNGFVTGYQTMDLFAAFFFSTLIFQQIQSAMAGASDRDVMMFAIKPSIIGSVLLGLVYLGFVFLGANYGVLLQNVAPEYMLSTIAQNVLGEVALVFIAIAMLFSCITTAVALNNIYARYLCKAFKYENFSVMLIVTTTISFAISLLDFRHIAAFLAPTLEVSYPGLILITITDIFLPQIKKFKAHIFWIATGVSILMLFI